MTKDKKQDESVKNEKNEKKRRAKKSCDRELLAGMINRGMGCSTIYMLDGSQNTSPRVRLYIQRVTGEIYGFYHLSKGGEGGEGEEEKCSHFLKSVILNGSSDITH